jgi:phosphodiesterase/alkaline phosphatase D-like protein
MLRAILRTSAIRALLLLAIGIAGLAGARPPALHGQKLVLFAYGVACGEPSSSDVELWTRVDAPATVVPEILDPSSGAVVRTLEPLVASAERDYNVKANADRLSPGTTIAYRFRGPNGELSATGSCRTAPDPNDDTPLTFGFSGDADWKWRPYPLLNALDREPLDFFVFLGDLIYETTNLQGTTSAEDLDGYRGKYRENREPVGGAPGPDAYVPLRDLYQAFGMYMVFDNHELGVSQADRTAPPYTEGGAPAGDGAHQFVNQTPGFAQRIEAFDEYQPLHARTVSGTGDPRLDGTQRFYSAQRWGRTAELFVTDDRSYRDVRLRNSDAPEADSPDRTMLGRPQLAWLEDSLSQAQAAGVTWKFVVVSSPIQQIGRESEIGVDLDGSKSWAGGYRFERDTLLKYIDDNAIENVVFLTTDNHNTMINNLRYHAVPGDPSSPLLPARNAFEILTGPIGASSGLAPVKADVQGLSGRDIDRRVIETLVGDVPNTDGVLKGQKQAGLDPLGLEPDFPGLVASSVWSDGGAQGVVEPEAFGAFNTYAYAVLAVTDTTLSVRVEGLPAVTDPTRLTNDAGLQSYEAETPHEVLRFQVQAQ